VDNFSNWNVASGGQPASRAGHHYNGNWLWSLWSLVEFGCVPCDPGELDESYYYIGNWLVEFVEFVGQEPNNSVYLTP